MERSIGLLLVLIATLAVVHLIQAQSQQGFISLDCGLPDELSPYNESNTGLPFSSDAKFIQSGKTGKVQANLETRFQKPYRTLRYFPDGKRNCYNLNVEKGRNHLIRASFVYGNYDDSNISPQFDLYLGPNLWATIDLKEKVNGTRKEIFHKPTSNSLQICLVKTGETTPMISSWEIRPMGNNSYITKSGSLELYFRKYLNESETYIRYPDDVYDRIWDPYFQKEWTQISTTSDVYNLNSYDPPKKALATAGIPTNVSEPLTIEWHNSDNPNAQYYLYRHFAEIQDLQANDTRVFNMVWNGEVTSNPVIPDKLSIDTFFSQSPRVCDEGKCSFQLIRTNNLTLPPLLNALEVYTVIHFPQSETNENDVAAIKSIKDAYELKRINWQGDPCVPQFLMWDGLNCSNNTPPRITFLNLSSTGLTGTIAAAIQSLTQLEKLDFSNNNLTGELPEFLGNIKSLLFINLSGNNLNGSVPRALQRKGLELLLHENPRLCHFSSCTKPSSRKFPVAIVASVAIVVILIASLVLFLVFRKRKLSTVQAPQLQTSMSPAVNVTSVNSHEPLIEMKKRRLTYSEVLKMTNNFQRVLGNGGFGVVYHGTLNDYQQVAVKLLSKSSTQGYKEFKAEVDLLLRVHHKNLVSLVGYCYEGDHLALVYEFLPNGDLKQHLSGGGSFINWSTRLRIALEAAQGLEYLHIGCTPPMVHRDVKTANILLDENFKAKLADFGLSRSFQGGDSTVTIAGTHGYLDPEYVQTSRLAEKSDVYSFGIVLLEMITNQPVINKTSENSHITQWVGFQINRGDILEIMDSNLRKDYDINSAWRALEVAMSCANPSSSKRPSMSQVIQELKECIVCENSGIRANRGLESEGMNVDLDTSVVPMAR